MKVTVKTSVVRTLDSSPFLFLLFLRPLHCPGQTFGMDHRVERQCFLCAKQRIKTRFWSCGLQRRVKGNRRQALFFFYQDALILLGTPSNLGNFVCGFVRPALSLGQKVKLVFPLFAALLLVLDFYCCVSGCGSETIRSYFSIQVVGQWLILVQVFTFEGSVSMNN